MLLLILFYVGSLIILGALSAILYKHKAYAKIISAVIAVMSLMLLVFIAGNFSGFKNEILHLNWSLPMADFSLGADFLSIFFMIPLLILSAACALYGAQYFRKGRAGRTHWLFYALLVAGMVMVLFARNVVLFMISWEIMSFSSFLLVISDARKESVRRAGWIYFVTAHIGTAFLFATFFLLSSDSASFNFELFGLVPFSVAKSNLIFIFALIGFGMKAGFIPFHIWLPLAHPAAPSHVSALMSGIMIKMGIYGILRVLTVIAPYQRWWGVILLVIGAVSGIIGVLFAIGQHDIKRLLAYSSVENVGIIFIGLGMGVLGNACGYPMVSMFGFSGALLHILNHSLFKGLLFLGAGAVIRQTGTGEIDDLGGLLKKLPVTGTLFLIGSIAITGLPFFNGFISELFIYIGAIIGAVSTDGTIMPMASALAVLSMAVIGGLAAACFTKVFGVVFQGKSRKIDVSEVEDVPSLMKAAMMFLSVLLIFTGMLSFTVVPLLDKPLLLLAGENAFPLFTQLSELSVKLTIILGVILSGILLLAGGGKLFSMRKHMELSDTWGCGYDRGSAAMQYTASSYSAPITDRFSRVLAAEKEINSDNTIFPEKPWKFKSKVEDWFLSVVYIRLVKLFDRVLSLLRWFQCGKAGVYVFYIGLTVIILLIWKFAL